MAAKHKYDLIFIDIHMPKMDGVDAAREILSKEGHHPIEIIALTANIAAESKEECANAGMSDFILKPFKNKEIEKVIQRVGSKKKQTA